MPIKIECVVETLSYKKDFASMGRDEVRLSNANMDVYFNPKTWLMERDSSLMDEKKRFKITIEEIDS